MFYVVDQSYMRRPELRELVRSSNCGFVIPDVAFEEMTKAVEWEDTLRNSFQILGPVLDRVVFSAGIGELVRYERANRLPIGEEQLMPEELTVAMREFIGAIVAGDETAGRVRKVVVEIRSDLAAERPGGPVLKAKMTELLTLLNKLYGPQLTQNMRNGQMSKDARLGQLRVLSEAFVDEFVRSLPANSASVTTRQVYAELWLLERWLRTGGFESVNPHRLMHDAFDAEYGVIASFTNGLLTRDKGAGECAADLRLMCSPEGGERLVDAYARYLADKAEVSGGSDTSPRGGGGAPSAAED